MFATPIIRRFTIQLRSGRDGRLSLPRVRRTRRSRQRQFGMNRRRCTGEPTRGASRDLSSSESGASAQLNCRSSSKSPPSRDCHSGYSAPRLRRRPSRSPSGRSWMTADAVVLTAGNCRFVAKTR